MNTPSPTLEFEIVCRDEQATERAARELALVAEQQLVIGLNGDLGAGKTCFVRAFARTAGVEGNSVNSPTYVIVQHYLGDFLIHHFDWYRVETSDELYEIGADELLDSSGISLVEWSDRFPDELPTDHLRLNFTVEEGSRRRIEMKATGKKSARVLQNFSEAWSS